MKKKILIAPLNWGLGHATRCIPIINALLEHGFEPILASDGIAKELLQKEFPDLLCLELPSYQIKYSRKGYLFKLQLLKDSRKIVNAIQEERKATETIVKQYGIDGIISDNRLGVHSKQVPSVFMTHQLQVLSGNTTWISTKMHANYISRFNECWVPDFENAPNLSGKLSHPKTNTLPLKYMGPLSRFKKLNLEARYDILILISGPEPQRSMLETKLLTELKNYKGEILLVRGCVEPQQTRTKLGNMTIYNYMISEDLEKAINESDLVISRSGYTTLMDLAKLGKKAFFIPTPGQFEQEYLAKRLMEGRVVPSCKQSKFTIEKLENMSDYLGLEVFDHNVDYKNLFRLFQGK